MICSHFYVPFSPLQDTLQLPIENLLVLRQLLSEICKANEKFFGKFYLTDK